MKKKEYLERFVTDILYADLEEGCVNFLKLAYDKLKLQDKKRLMKMRKQYHKISGNVMNAVFEDIIGIITEEICQKGNKELNEDLMDYYSKRYPLIKEEFEKCENDIEEWLDLYMDSVNSYVIPEDADTGLETELYSKLYSGREYNLENLRKRSFVLLCCITYGENNVVNRFFEVWDDINNLHYDIGNKYNFYVRQGNGGDTEWIEKLHIYKRILNKKGYKTYIENVRESLAVYFDTDSNHIEEEIFWMVAGARPNLSRFNHYEILEDELDFLEMHDCLNDICWRHHVSQLELRDCSKQMYLDIIRRNIEKWCSKELFNSYFEAGETNLNYVMLEKEFGRYEMEKCVSELITMIWFEFYMMNQQELWDEYYKRFSFDSPEEEIKKLLRENSSLKEENNSLNRENSRHKKKIEEYADADAERKRRQNKEVKKNDRKYIEQIALVERQLEEQKKENEKLQQMLGNRDRYIGLLETGNDAETSGKEIDYSKFYNIRIAFIGGKTETVSRLKALFRNAAFINDETTKPPHKIDLIVILAGSENHALAYKYIGLAGKQNVNVIYSASTNIESIVQKVADSI